jgi:hypothetical protein
MKASPNAGVCHFIGKLRHIGPAMGDAGSCCAGDSDIRNVLASKSRLDDSGDSSAHDAMRARIFRMHRRIVERLPGCLTVSSRVVVDIAVANCGDRSPTDRHQPVPEPSPWPFSGRGEKRPQTGRAKRTNFPLEPPAALRGKGNTPAGRRWRDLCRFYGNRLGAERLKDEATRAKLLALIHLTLRLEAARDAGQKLPLHSELHAVQELRTLLQDLGLNEPMRSEGPPDLHDYLARKNNGAMP